MTSHKSVLTHQGSVLTPTESLELDRIDPQHDGQISGKTLRDAARRASHLRDSNMFLKKGICVASVLLLLSWLGNFGLVFVAVNLSKDLKVEGGSLKGSDGGSIRTHNQETVYTATVASESRRQLQLSDGADVVATVPWAAVNLAIENIQAGETSGKVSFPLCDNTTAIYPTVSTSFYTTNAAGYFGINLYLNGDTDAAYHVSCESASSTGDYECPVAMPTATRRRALSFEDAFDGDLDAHAKNSRRLALGLSKDCNNPTANLVFDSPLPVDLGTAGNFVILTKTGVTNTGVTEITGDMGTSPIASTAITGFALTLDTATTTFATSPYITGKVYAASYTSPTPSTMTTAIGDMQTAYVDAAGRANPDEINLSAGNIDGMTIQPGLYKWSTSVGFSTLTLLGDANDVWIMQIAGDLNVNYGALITLSGGALAENIFWQVAGKTTVQTTAAMQGIILCATSIDFLTGSSLNGAALSQTAVTLDAATISA